VKRYITTDELADMIGPDAAMRVYELMSRRDTVSDEDFLAQIAKAFDVPPAMILQAAELDKAAPELSAEVRAGRMTLAAAYRTVEALRVRRRNPSGTVVPGVRIARRPSRHCDRSSSSQSTVRTPNALSST
jgi:hypothetical protein